MLSKLSFLCSLLFLLLSNRPTSGQSILKEGTWCCELKISDNESIPFLLKVTGSKSGKQIELVNGKEEIPVQGNTIKGDSIFITPSFFQTEIRAVIKDTLMEGLWSDYARVGQYVVPFRGVWGKTNRFTVTQKPSVDFNGKWEIHFSPQAADSSAAIGVFTQDASHISGTFLTTTGDYRFLDGVVSRDSLYLSAFDGAHAYLFKAAMLSNHTISGKYWSGNHWSEAWVGKRNDSFQLPEAETLTYLKEGFKTISFSLPDVHNKIISLSDSTFKNKVVLIQIMGSWCPNCMDETHFLVPFYNANRKSGLAIIALDYERKNDRPYVEKTLQYLKYAYHISYPLLFAGLTKDASSSLPMLNKVMGYPTLIAIDRKGNVRWIETGINGPATGDLYNKWCEQLSNKIALLLQEK